LRSSFRAVVVYMLTEICGGGNSDNVKCVDVMMFDAMWQDKRRSAATSGEQTAAPIYN
jgi:hypothetical protein